MRGRRGGFTLIETLLSLVLLALVFTVAYQVLVPSWRLWQINQQQANIEESGLVIETRFLRDVEHSTASSLVQVPAAAGSAPSATLQAVSFSVTGTEDGPDSFDPSSGQPLWQSYVMYFVPAGTHTLYRKIWPVPWLAMNAQTPPATPRGQTPVAGQLPYTFPNSAPVPLAPRDLATLCQTPNGTEIVLGSAVTTLSVDAVVGSPNTAQLTVDLDTPSLLGTATSQRVRQFHFWM